MSQPVHKPGPLHVDGQNIIRHEAQVGIARVFGHIGQPREANARLLTAAYNAFDSAAWRLNCNAVELAERMQNAELAELHDCLKDILSRFRSCIAQGNGEIEGDKEAIARAEAIIAKVKGGPHG